MRTIFGSRRNHHLAKASVFLITAALIAGMAGCGPVQYNLTISSTEGGEVTTPGEGMFTYDKGTVVDLVAEADEGYMFVNWTGNVSAIADVNAASTTITMNGDYSITANFAIAIEIWDWYDLDDVSDNLAGNYTLMNDLDSTTPGYKELASPTANGGKGWQPIGTDDDLLTGSFDGQGYEISDLFINRPGENGVGLFVAVWQDGVVKNIGVVMNVTVTGDDFVGGLVGWNAGNVSNSYFSGSVTGTGNVGCVGGLVGYNEGNVSDSYATGNVTGNRQCSGGLVGANLGTVGNSYATGNVTGDDFVGGLVGGNLGTVGNSYATGNVTGDDFVGGLVGGNDGTVSNSYYNYAEVLINGESIITTGALFGEDFDQWLANDKFLDINERLSKEIGYYVINNVADFKELLAFGQDGSLKFRLKNDLDLATEPNFYIPYFAGEFDGNGHKISDLSFNFDFVSDVGLFGHLAPGGKVTQVGVENVNITGGENVGGLVGYIWEGTVSDSYATGSVTGDKYVGGLVGFQDCGTISNSYSTCSVNSSGSFVGGLVGETWKGTVSNCYSTGSVNSSGSFVGGLVGDNDGTVTNSFWDTQTSGQSTSDGGTGKNTTEMQDIATFTDTETEGLDEPWDIIAVADPGTRNPSYIWNIVDDVTYPFLSWQP